MFEKFTEFMHTNIFIRIIIFSIHYINWNYDVLLNLNQSEWCSACISWKNYDSLFTTHFYMCDYICVWKNDKEQIIIIIPRIHRKIFSISIKKKNLLSLFLDNKEVL